MSIRSKLAAIFHIDTSSLTPQALSFMDAHGRVIEPIKPNSTGRIKLQGVSWLARCSDTLLHPLPIDTPIQVIDRVGLTLIVRPLAIPT
ncbi:MAG: NfeD family protein, partial [Cyanobacteria bacterium P01_D01_bin.56]